MLDRFLVNSFNEFYIGLSQMHKLKMTGMRSFCKHPPIILQILSDIQIQGLVGHLQELSYCFLKPFSCLTNVFNLKQDLCMWYISLFLLSINVSSVQFSR